MRRSVARELAATLGLVALLILAPTAYARNWPPAVIVESSSMMHEEADASYGRLGTIDPGDLVVVKRIEGVDDVLTFVEADAERYERAGDVIVYFPAGDRGRTPIIHRAMAYVERAGDGFRVRWDPAAACEGNGAKDPRDAAWCLHPPEGLVLPSLGLDRPYVPDGDGFITKGDNPATNPVIDPLAGISVDARGRPAVVRVEWVDGKARGELPWLGLLKLALAREPNEDAPPASYVRVGNAHAPGDLWVMLVVSLVVLVGAPTAWDLGRAWRERRRERE